MLFYIILPYNFAIYHTKITTKHSPFFIKFSKAKRKIGIYKPPSPRGRGTALAVEGYESPSRHTAPAPFRQGGQKFVRSNSYPFKSQFIFRIQKSQVVPTWLFVNIFVIL